jgi:hypothetical protein
LWVVVASVLVFLLGSELADRKEQAAADPDIRATVQHLLAQYGIDPRSVSARKHSVGTGGFARIERRVSVAPEFNTLNFHLDLSRAMAEHHATVAASEKSEDGSVAMHIKKDGVIVESIVFLPKPSR